MRFNWSNRPQIKIEPKLECGSLSQREFQVLIFGETLQVDVLYNLEFADYIQDTRISPAQGNYLQHFDCIFMGRRWVWFTGSIKSNVAQYQCTRDLLADQSAPISPSSPAQPAQQCECFQPVLSVELCRCKVNSAQADTAGHDQVTHPRSGPGGPGGDSWFQKMVLSAKQTYIS